MANLEFCDKHNMVAYLKKPTGSEGFQEIVDFINDSYIRYALTKNPTIYVSLIEKFWQTATVRTVDNREQEITATFDGKEFTITKASVRRHLQLADVDEPILNVVSSLHQKTQTPRQALNQVTELPQTSEPIPNVPDEAVYEEWDDRVERATTTAASLDAEQASGGIPKFQEAIGGSIAQTRSDRVPTQSYDSPLLRVHTLRSDEGRVTLVTPTHSQEDQHEYQLGVFSAAKVLADAAKENFHTYTRRRRAVSTGNGKISISSRLFSTAEESVSTAGVLMPVSTVGMVQEVNISIPSPVVSEIKLRNESQYSEVDHAKMLVDLINQRKKYFVAQKAEAKRNKPMTQAQQRIYMVFK
ncbi:hypothetical protein Tco_0117458 [Tanacetum coccineum]